MLWKSSKKRKRVLKEHYLYSVVPAISPGESTVLGLESIWWRFCGAFFYKVTLKTWRISIEPQTWRFGKLFCIWLLRNKQRDKRMAKSDQERKALEAKQWGVIIANMLGALTMGWLALQSITKKFPWGRHYSYPLFQQMKHRKVK